MDFNYDIECIDRYGQANNFKYSIEKSQENDFEKLIFRVVPANLNTDDWFEFSIVKIDDTTGKISSMNNNSIPELSGKGIPDKLIELIALKFNLKIISSSNKPSSQKLDTEWRTIDANKVWDRLIKQNKALYDSDLDIYTYCP